MCALAERHGLAGLPAQWVLLRVPAGLEPGRLADAAWALVTRHDMLRARLSRPAGEWRVEILPAAATPPDSWLRRVSVAGRPDAGLDAGLTAAAVSQARQAAGRLDPAAGVMMQAVWLDAGPRHAGGLLIAAHQLAADAASWPVLLADLASARVAAAGGQPGSASFPQWARSLPAQAHDPGRVAELPAWAALLQDGEPWPPGWPPPGSEPPGSEPPDPGTGWRSFAVPAPDTAALLTGLPAAFHVSPGDVLAAALAAAVAQWRQHHGAPPGPVLMDVADPGRLGAADADLTQTVGPLTGTHPVRLTPGAVDLAAALAGDAAAGALLRQIKEQLRAVPGDGCGYALLRHLNADTAAILARLPEPRIGFAYLGRIAAVPPGPGGDQPDASGWPVLGSSLPAGMMAARAVTHPVEAAAVVQDLAGGPELTISLAWQPPLVTEAQAADLAGGWLAMLHGLAAHAARPGAGGHTSSDFPLAALSDNELSELEARWRTRP
jgi:nonribosomal peptide synthetase CepB